MSCLSNTYVHIIIKTVFEKDHFFVILGEKLKKKKTLMTVLRKCLKNKDRYLPLNFTT